MNKIVIIGGGLSGLACGIYARMNGFETIIIEKNPTTGGMCTGWERKGYYLDGCTHWLTGTKENTVLNQMWKTLGAFSNQEDIIYLDIWGSIEYDGQEVVFYRDVNKAEQEWINKFPIDKKPIKHFFKCVRKIMKFDLPLEAPASLLPFNRYFLVVRDFFKTFPYYFWPMQKSCEEYAERFKSPALKFAITHIQPGKGNLFSMMFSYATICLGNGGIPKGGSKLMCKKITDRYLALGGELITSKEVSGFAFAKGKIISATLKDGSQIFGDYFVTACDTNYVINNLLNKKYKVKAFSNRYDNYVENPSPSCCLLYFEVDINFDINIPHSFPVEPFIVMDKKITHLTLRNYKYDEVYVHGNKCVMQVLLDQDSVDYEGWDKLKNDRNGYLKEKGRIAKCVTERIITHYPNLKGRLTLLDMCTPLTLNKFVNASRGSYMGFLFNKKLLPIMHNGKVKGIKNIWLSGQYTMCPGGLPLAITSGKFSFQRIVFSKRTKLIRYISRPYYKMTLDKNIK